MSTMPTVQATDTAPPRYAGAQRTGADLLTLNYRLGRGSAVLTRCRFGDGLRHLANWPTPDTRAVSGSAPVTAFARAHADAWDLEVRFPRCGCLHPRGVDAGSLAEFVRRAPPRDGSAYWLMVAHQ
jgi:hypothetical protein